MKRALAAFAGAALLVGLAATSASAQVLFWANQAVPVEEAQKMRDNVLKNFPGGADFQGQDPGPGPRGPGGVTPGLAGRGASARKAPKRKKKSERRESLSR